MLEQADRKSNWIWRKWTKHSVWLGTVPTDYFKFDLPAGICETDLNRLNVGDKHSVPSDPCRAWIHIPFSLTSNNHHCNWCNKIFSVYAVANCATESHWSRYWLPGIPLLWSQEWIHAYSMKADQSHPRSGRSFILYINPRPWTPRFKSSLWI